MNRPKEKVVLITGAGKGSGRILVYSVEDVPEKIVESVFALLDLKKEQR